MTYSILCALQIKSGWRKFRPCGPLISVSASTEVVASSRMIIRLGPDPKPEVASLLHCSWILQFSRITDRKIQNTSEQTFIPYNCVQVEFGFIGIKWNRIAVSGKYPNTLKDRVRLCMLRVIKIKQDFVLSRKEESIYRLSRRVPRNRVVSCGTKAIRERKVVKDTCDIS